MNISKRILRGAFRSLKNKEKTTTPPFQKSDLPTCPHCFQQTTFQVNSQSVNKQYVFVCRGCNKTFTAYANIVFDNYPKV